MWGCTGSASDIEAAAVDMAAAAAALVYIERELLKMVSAQARPASHRRTVAVLCGPPWVLAGLRPQPGLLTVTEQGAMFHNQPENTSS